MDKIKFLKLIIHTCVLFVLCQCSTTPDEDKESPLPKSQSSYPDYRTTGGYNDIDVDALVRELNMNSPFHEIGFNETSFNPCQIRSNKSPRPLCQRMYLGKVNYQVVCRRSTGTVEKVSLRPLMNGRLRWRRGPHKGYTRTNSQGYGTIYYISRKPSYNNPMYLYLGSKVARKRLRDMWKLVLPNNWCAY